MHYYLANYPEVTVSEAYHEITATYECYESNEIVLGTTTDENYEGSVTYVLGDSDAVYVELPEYTD